MLSVEKVQVMQTSDRGGFKGCLQHFQRIFKIHLTKCFNWPN